MTGLNAVDPTSRSDLAELQCSWSQSYLEADGVANPDDDEHTSPGAVCIIEGQDFRVIKPDGTLLLKGSFTLNATTYPKSITWIDAIGEDAGTALPAIYELSADMFQFVAADEGQPRPSRFENMAGLTMRVFVRVD